MEQDKVKHLIAGFVITIIGGLVFVPFALFGLLSGFVKEWLDARMGGTVDDADVWYTCIGAAIGLFVLLVYLCVKLKRSAR
jgi:branched-subunit amino acid ABC-type transport system permease component